MTQAIETLQNWMDDTGNIVFYSGFGLSREGGVSDYRRMEENHFETYKYPVETILTRPFFERKPELFFQYYRNRVLAPLLTAEPTAAHKKLVELEQADKLRMIITQNFDELHQEAGSRKILELYGSVMRNNCPRCERFLSALDIYERSTAPTCDVDMCGGVITPDIFLYGDALNQDILSNAIYYALTANLLIVAGTSLTEFPAASIVHHYTGNKLVLINEEEGPLDHRANLIIRAPVSEVMEQLTVNPTP